MHYTKLLLLMTIIFEASICNPIAIGWAYHVSMLLLVSYLAQSARKSAIMPVLCSILCVLHYTK